MLAKRGAYERFLQIGSETIQNLPFIILVDILLSVNWGNFLKDFWNILKYNNQNGSGSKLPREKQMKLRIKTKLFNKYWLYSVTFHKLFENISNFRLRILYTTKKKSIGSVMCHNTLLLRARNSKNFHFPLLFFLFLHPILFISCQKFH